VTTLTGQYFRRIKAVGLSIPCVVGPYTGVNATLTLLRSTVRHNPTLIDDEPDPYAFGEDDERVTVRYAAGQSIATSSAQNDSGVFELNFRDERYLPFEGEGAISRWRLELADTFRPIDYDTITDAVMHLRYTARPGGEQLKQAATASLGARLQEVGASPLARLISLRHEFPSEWHRFLNPAGTTADQRLEFSFTDRFPLIFQNAGTEITITQMDAYVNAAEGLDLELRLGPSAAGAANSWDLTGWGGLLTGTTGEISEALNPWTLKVNGGPPAHQRVPPEAIKDIVLVCHYTVQT
jgi:hypothetical protein